MGSKVPEAKVPEAKVPSSEAARASGSFDHQLMYSLKSTLPSPLLSISLSRVSPQSSERSLSASKSKSSSSVHAIWQNFESSRAEASSAPG